MKRQTDYSKGLIYKICCNDVNIKDIYIGSTVDFERRKGVHKLECINENRREYNSAKYKFIRDNGGWEEWSMVELYKYPCDNKRELEKEEDKMMMKLKSSLNDQRAFITEDERRKGKYDYFIKNREKQKITEKKYRIDNRETIKMRKNERIECNKCGCFVNRGNISTHKKSLKCINYNKPPPDTLDNNKE